MGKSVKNLISQATIALNTGNKAQGEKLLIEATKTSKSSAEAWAHMADFLTSEKRYAEAITAYKKVFAKKHFPTFAFNYAHCYYHIGELEKAGKLFKQSLTFAPHRDDAWNAYCNTFSYLHPVEEWLKLKRDRPTESMPDWIYGAEILKYTLANLILGNKNEFLKHFTELSTLKERITKISVAGLSQKEIGVIRKRCLHLVNYILIIATLKDNAVWEQPAENAPRIYALGDSHTLAMARHKFKVKDEILTCDTKVIVGCKAWHLGQEGNNFIKESFLRALNRLPEGSTVLSVVGEIDCRHDEGMLPYAVKRGQELEPVIEKTTSTYIQFLKTHAKGKHIIVAGVAAPKPQAVNTLPPQYHNAFIGMIDLFNQRLKHYAELANFDFVDAHALTKKPGGMTKDGFHLDFRHLKGTAWQQAFEEHYINNS